MLDRAHRVKFAEPRRDGSVALERCVVRRRSMRGFSNRALSEDQLGQLLWAAQGVTSADGKRGSEVDDLIEARERAIGRVRTIMSRPGPEDWRRWVLHVSDGDGEEIFALPLSSLIGELH